jgi:RNA polymerase sigma-70 factor, ECF subfamily
MEDLSEIIHKAQQGDENAYGQIYQLYYKKIYRYCKINIYSQELAQDLTQETFIKGWRSIKSFTPKNGGTIQAYLFRIARNLMIDHSRKKKEEHIEYIEEIQSKESIEDDFDKKQEQEMIKQALMRLDEVDRQIIILRYFEEMSFEEVSKVTKVNEGALRVRTHRILKKLKEIVEDGG